MRRVGGLLLVMGSVLVATWVAFRAVGEVSPGWSLLVIMVGAAIQWAIYSTRGKPALDGWVQSLYEDDADEPAELDDPGRRRRADRSSGSASWVSGPRGAAVPWSHPGRR